MSRKTNESIKTKKEDGPDVTDPKFWDSMGFELLEVKDDGKILVKDLVTGSDMTFNTSWTPFRIAKAASNARAQYLK